MITLYLQARTKPGHREALEKFLAEARPIYEAPGGIRVRLQWNRADPDAFYEIIEYDNEAAYLADDERTRTDPHMIALLQRWNALLTAPPTVMVFEEHEPRATGSPRDQAHRN